MQIIDKPILETYQKWSKKLDRNDLRIFVLIRIEDFAKPQIEKYLKATTAEDHGHDRFYVSDLAAHFGWKLEACQRMLNALIESGMCMLEQTSTGIAFKMTEHRRETYAQTELIQWFNSEIESSSLGAIISYVDQIISFAGSLSLLYKSEPNLFSEASNLMTLTFYRHVVRRAMTNDCILLGLERGGSVADVAFELSSSRLFDHYDKPDDLMALHALTFAFSNWQSNLDLADYLEKTGSTKFLDIGGGIGQVMLACKSIFLRPAEFTVMDHPSTQFSLQKLRTTVCGADDLIIRRFYHDFTVQHEKASTSTQLEAFDCLILGWILHDWDDLTSHFILRNALAYLEAGGKIIVLERPLEDDRIKNAGYDFNMLLQAGGKERTLSEYDDLLRCHNLKRIDLVAKEVGRHFLVYERGC